MIEFGPYTAGEVPERLEVLMADAAGAPLPLDTDPPYTAEMTYRRLWPARAEPVTKSDGVDVDPATSVATVTWLEDDMAEPGLYVGRVWVANGINRLSSDPLAWSVEAAGSG